MKTKKKEGNILSFKIVIDTKGNLITEFSGLPLEKAHLVFKVHDLILIQKLIKEGRVHLENLHTKLQNELQSLST